MLTQKQENFVRFVFEGMTQREAWKQAGYSCNYSMAVLDVHASQLFHKDKVQIRYQELQKAADDASVMSVLERKQVLSEIGRGRLSDFIEAGMDGSWINIDKDKMNTAALQAIDSKTEYDDDGAHPTVVTKIRLHSPTQAIDLLNKMDKLYDDKINVLQDNRVQNVYINSNGHGELKPFKEIIDGNGHKDSGL